MTTNSWDNTVTVILIQRVNKYSPGEEMVAQLRSSQVCQIIATCKTNNKSNNNATIQRTTLNITLSNVCFSRQLLFFFLPVSPVVTCSDLGTARHGARDMYHVYVQKGACMGLSQWRWARGEKTVLSQAFIVVHLTTTHVGWDRWGLSPSSALCFSFVCTRRMSVNLRFNQTQLK